MCSARPECVEMDPADANFHSEGEKLAVRSESSQPAASPEQFAQLKTLIPKLLDEMAQDLVNYPLRREFVLLGRRWSYQPGRGELMYYYDDHEDLDNQVRILQNLRLVESLPDQTVRLYAMQ